MSHNWHKDKLSLYMFRNVFSTLLVALLSFVISLMNFYGCELNEALQRLFLYDVYTTLYFILIWVFDYFVFEMSKIIYDIYEQKVTFIPAIGLVGLGIVVIFIPILDMYKYNFWFLSLLICVRMGREMWRKNPELFVQIRRFVDNIKKRPESGLK